MTEQRVNTYMERLGVPVDSEGPHVEELRVWIRTRIEQGMVNMSGGTWGDKASTLSPDERAKAFLAFMWSANHYAYPVTAASIDGGPVRMVTDVTTMRRKLRIKWKQILPTIGYAFVRVGTRARHWFDHNIRGIRNPYLP
jgi:hypothetical protein